MSFLLLCTLSSTSCSDFFVDPQIVSITVTPPTPSLVVGGVQQFSAVAKYDDGSSKVLGDCNWSSSNATILYVNSWGMATALAAGSATLTASYDIGVGSTTVTVNSSPLTAITITPINPSISLAANGSQQFAALATFSDGSQRDVTASVNWTSSNTAVATVNTSGLATAKLVGTTVIKVTSGTITDQTTLTVTQ